MTDRKYLTEVCLPSSSTFSEDEVGIILESLELALKMHDIDSDTGTFHITVLTEERCSAGCHVLQGWWTPDE